jgi:PAS domain S-box-containing protein
MPRHKTSPETGTALSVVMPSLATPSVVAAADPANEFWEATSHFETVLNCLTDYAILTLDVAGNVTGWNSGAARTKGYEKGEILGRHFSLFYTPEDQEAGLPMRALQLAAESGKHETEGWRVRKNGERFWASLVLQPITDSDGTIRGFVKVTRDISQRLQLEKLREELSQSQRLEMVGQLTGGVAHDFNNLLTIIEAGHDLVLNYSQDERIARVMEINKSAVDRSRKLIAQLLAFARRQVLNPRRSNIWDLISTLDVLIQRAVGSHIRLRWNLQPELPLVLIDQAQFHTVLLNLVVNARDAMREGGWLTVFMEKLSLTDSNYPPPYNVPAGDYVVLGVSDTGEGMSEEVCARAIEPFFTTKDVGKGTGLGLSQCYGFARQSGGTLRIESVKGRGTTVRIVLPALNAGAATAPGKRARTILVVDDDASIRTLVGEMLRILGHKVVEAEDGRDALRQLEKDDSIDYLFTDIIMPNDMNGLQLVNAARAARPGLPSLLASGYPREVLRDLGNIPEDVSFIAKPYSLSDINAHINSGFALQ